MHFSSIFWTFVKVRFLLIFTCNAHTIRFSYIGENWYIIQTIYFESFLMESKLQRHLIGWYISQFSCSIPFEDSHIVLYSELEVPTLFWKLVSSSQNRHFLEIDSINLFPDIHHWKAESLSFPTVCGTILEIFFWYNASLVNRWKA